MIGINKISVEKFPEVIIDNTGEASRNVFKKVFERTCMETKLEKDVLTLKFCDIHILNKIFDKWLNKSINKTPKDSDDMEISILQISLLPIKKYSSIKLHIAIRSISRYIVDNRLCLECSFNVHDSFPE